MPAHARPLDAPRAPALRPGEGCLAAPGRWVLSLTGRPVRCVQPEARPDAEAPAPVEAVAAVAQVLRRAGAGAPAEVVIGADLDPLQAGGPWQDAALAAAERLVAHGVGLRLVTRGVPDAAFSALLRRAAAAGGAVLEVRLFTLDAALSALYEPGAPPPAERLGAAAQVARAGVRVEARLEPLIPWISDTAAHLEGLLRALAGAGVQRVRASYLQLDAQDVRRLVRLPAAHRALIRGCLAETAARPGERRLLPLDLRRQGHQRLARLGLELGLPVSACRETDPDLPGAGACLEAPSRPETAAPTPAPRRRARPAAPEIWGRGKAQLALFA